MFAHKMLIMGNWVWGKRELCTTSATFFIKLKLFQKIKFILKTMIEFEVSVSLYPQTRQKYDDESSLNL